MSTGNRAAAGAGAGGQQRTWRDLSVLVTGATGLLGSWLVRRLLAEGADVVALVRDQVPGSALWRHGDDRRIRIARGSVEDAVLVQRVVHEHGAVAVFHLAAQTVVGTALAHPSGTLATNIAGTWSVLEASRTCPTVRGVVVASSDKAYGDQGERALDEGDPLLATHPYDASKACADLLARGFAATYGLPVVVTRCGNLYGGGDLQWSRVVPGTIRSALRGERPIVRSDGTPVRDYLYVEDAADFYVRAMDALLWPEPGRIVAGKAFNASPGRPASVMEVVRLVLELAGRPDLEPRVLGQALQEIPYQALSPERARTSLAWSARTDLRQGLTQTLQWYRDHLDWRTSAGHGGP